MSEDALSSEELAALDRLLATVHERTGMDFTDYARSALYRRVLRAVFETRSGSIDGLRDLVCRDVEALRRVGSMLTLSVTSMFRDPTFFLQFREQVVPLLRTHAFLRMWVAGCAAGQEVYSLAILLHEAGLYERTRLYATELQAGVLEQARAGIYPLAGMQEYTRNYLAAGGTGSLSDYYTAHDPAGIIPPF